MTSKRRFLTAWAILAGFAPFLAIHWLYQLGLLIGNQAGLVRMAGVMIVFSGALALGAAGLALAASRLPTERLSPRVRRWGRTAFYLGATAALVDLGLCLFYWSPKLAPAGWLAGCGLAWLALGVAFWRYDAKEQVFVTRTLLHLGHAALALPWLALPWVLHGMATNPARVAQSPLPLDAPAVRPDAPKRIVLVSFDALRARSTSLHTPGTGQTPTLEALAEEATWYANCRTTGEHTLLAMSSMLTGVAPIHLFPKVGNRLGYIRQGAVTGLAGHLAAAGYRAYYATMLIHPSVLGVGPEFERGVYNARSMVPSEFNTQAYLPLGESLRWLGDKLSGRLAPEPHEQQRLRAARKTLTQARELLRAAPERTFLWVHLGVPHDQYYSVPPIADDGINLDPHKAVRADLVKLRRGDRAQLAHTEQVYEDYVKFGDAELGRFLNGLKADGLWEDTMLIVASDHGEEFRPEGAGHGFGTLSEEVTHVPLLIRYPQQPQGRRDDGTTSLLDVTPTVLSSVFQRIPDGFEGVPLQAGAPAPGTRTIYTYGLLRHDGMDRPGPNTYAAYQHPFKYLLNRRSGQERLFDLSGDPRQDVAERHPERFEALREQVRRALEAL